MAPSEPLKKKQAARSATPNQRPVLRRVAGNASLRDRSRQGAYHKNDRPPPQLDTLDNYYQEMSRVEMAMEFFNNYIAENMAGVHLEIKTRVENGEAGEHAAPVTQHLAQMLPAPPVSPVSPGSIKSKTRDNPTDLKAHHQEKRAKIHQAILKDETFGSLLRRDNYFHALMNDLNGLRQWCNSCRLEWTNRKGEKVAMEKTLNALAAQKRRLGAQLRERNMIGPKGASKAAELLRLEKQYTLQMVRLEDTGVWFGETAKLLNSVKLRFKELQLESKKAEKDLHPEDTLPADFEYVFDGINIPDFSKAPLLPSWWKSDSPLWWLGHATTDLEMKGHNIEASIAKTNVVLYECNNLLDDTRQNIQDFKKDQEERIEGTEKQIEVRRQEMQEIYANNPARRAWLEDNLVKLYHLRRSTEDFLEKELQYKKSLITALDKEREMRLFDHKDLTVRLERINAVTELARSTQHAVRKIDVTQPHILACLSIVHDICCAHAYRTETSQCLQEIINDGVLSYNDKIQLTSQKVNHFKYWEPRYILVVRCLKAVPEGKLDDSAILQEALEITQHELDGLLAIVNEAEQLLKARATAIDNPTIITSHAPEVVMSEPEGQPWGQIKTLLDAKMVLNELDSRGISTDKRLGQILREYFTSPDVAPNFENVSKLTKTDFFDLVNTFLDEDYAFTAREIEAFLLYCNEIAELFILVNDCVSATADGWELVDESPIGGPPRKFLLAPENAEFFAERLVKCPMDILGRLKITGAQRDTEEDALIYIMQKYTPLPWPMGTESWQTLLVYFSHAGKFFRYLPILSQETGQPVLRRINNGWALDPVSERLELFEHGPKAYFQPIRHAITSNITREILPPSCTVGELYATLQRVMGGFKYGGFFGLNQKEVTLYKFHLFLRWCHQMNDLFVFKNNEEIETITAGWDQKY